MDSKASALHRAEDQQLIGAYVHRELQYAMSNFPSVVWPELIDYLKAEQTRRALHYRRARNLLGVHD